MPEKNKASFGSKRGRPKRATLPDKILEGEENEDDRMYKCPECNRLFPRTKSLKAHLRIHNGERPYLCDYPNCSRAFCQSGQLRTHHRTHTGEKVFACPHPACETRFIHINRCCPFHPELKLQRDGKGKVYQDTRNLSYEEVLWLERYKAEKENPAKRRRKDSVITLISPGINSLSDANNLPDADSSDTNSSDTNSLSDSNTPGDVEDDKTLKYLEARKIFHSEKSQQELEGAESLIELHVKPIVFSQM